MQKQLPNTQLKRAQYLVDLAWDIFYERIASGKIVVNKESSMQLHYATIIHNIGEVFCVLPSETFSSQGNIRQTNWAYFLS